jgi:hypothetical protein
MRRLISIAAFALLLALPLWAQRGGHGGGGHGGMSGGRGGGFAGHSGGGGQVSGGMHGGAGFSHGPVRSSRSSFSQQPFLHNGHNGHHGHHNGNVHFHTFGVHNNCFGWNCRGSVYPWWGSAYYDPWWYDSGSSYDEAYERDRAVANEMNRQSLEEQRMRRQEESDGDEDSYAPRSATRRSAPSREGNEEQRAESISPATVLVFRDQHRREISNYAIVGQTLWNFASGRTEKIALAGLDLPATEKANDDRGVTFRVPAVNEGQ